MSNNLDPLSDPLNIQKMKEIDSLDLPIIQKHHVRILAHCLQILKIINVDDSFEYQNRNPLREWSDNQSKKLTIFSKTIGKNIQDLEIDDLVRLVEQR